MVARNSISSFGPGPRPTGGGLGPPPDPPQARPGPGPGPARARPGTASQRLLKYYLKTSGGRTEVEGVGLILFLGGVGF